MTVRLWTDGCCLSNPGGAGGWAFVAEDKGRTLATRNGSAVKTTNNKMELAAAIEALKWAAEQTTRSGEAFEVWSDSQYVVKGMNTWRKTWKANGWRRKPTARTPVKNLDQWEALDALDARVGSAQFVWVKGHNGSDFNELADRLAAEAAEKENE